MDKVDFRRLDLSQLMIFSELMRRRKTTVVADKLALSQSTVSHAIGRMREIFGDQLFVRIGNVGLQPTSRAFEIAPAIEQMLSLAKGLGGAPPFDPLTANAHFRITGTFLTASLVAPMIAADLPVSAPNTTFSYSSKSVPQALESLAQHDADLAIVAGPMAAGFQYTELLTDDSVVVVRRGHPKVTKPLDLDTYLSLEHLNLAPDGEMIGEADRVLDEMNLVRHVVASLGDMIAALKVVVTSDLALTMPRSLTSPYADNFAFEIHPYPLEEQRILRVARHARTDGDPALDWLIERMRQIVRPSSVPG